jgi:hypothetical protein
MMVDIARQAHPTALVTAVVVVHLGDWNGLAVAMRALANVLVIERAPADLTLTAARVAVLVILVLAVTVAVVARHHVVFEVAPAE